MSFVAEQFCEEAETLIKDLYLSDLKVTSTLPKSYERK